MKLNTPANLMEQVAQLSPEKRALLELKLKEKLQGAGNKTSSVRREQRTSAPLSFTQQRFWFLDQLEPDLPLYHEWTAVRLRGPLNLAVLEQSINAIVRRHEALRTTFAVQDGEPVQIIAPVLTVPLPVINLQPLPAAARWDEAKRLAKTETQRPFDLAHGPLFRVLLFQIDEQESVLLLTFHHIVIDAWSATVFYRELGALYTAFLQQQPTPLTELPVQYADFAVWQQQWLQSPTFNTQLAYWRKQLADLPPLQLPIDRPRPPKQTYRGAQQSISLPAALVESLNALSQQAGASLFMTLLAAFQTMLHRYTGQDDIVVGSPIANRNRPEIEGLIGCFTNTLVLRSDLAGNPTFRTLLARVRATVLDALAHQDLPFEKLVEELQPERDLSRTPLFQVMFVFNNTALTFTQLGGVRVEPVDFESTMVRFDLTLSIMELETGFKGQVAYNADLFDAATIERMVGHFQNLLAGIVDGPLGADQPIALLPLLTTPERQQLLVEWNATQTDYPQDKCIHQLFEMQVASTPDAEALVFEDQRLTYQELNQRANQLAHYLQTLGVGRGVSTGTGVEVPVGVCLERSVEMVIGLLGILKAGGAYVPLDPAYPPERVAFMLEDGQPLVLLTQEALLPTLPQSTAQVLCLDRDWSIFAQQPTTNPASAVTAHNLAYILYTSGSTGRPKGVEIEHHSAVALIDWTRSVFTQEEIAGTLASTSICFDLSVFELFVPLSRGGKVILAPNALHLPALPAAAEVTLINTVPSAMTELVRNRAVPDGVKVVNLAGEPLKNALVQQVYQSAKVQRVFNLYGPSEDTTYSTFTLVEQGATMEPTIGRPIANTQLYLLDSQLQPVPLGVIGELYIGGEGLARGYRNRPALTEEKFIPNPFGKLRTGPFAAEASSQRLYRTGDLARYLPDSKLEFLGRRDNQVKLRGFRIELGEIETALTQHPTVREAVVVVREDQGSDKRLVAYITTNSEQNDPLELTLADHLRRTLPYYMVPASFVCLAALPLTPNGKVDRRALPAPLAIPRSAADTFVPPSTPTEASVAAIWCAVLGVEQVGIHDDFFAIGGHSLLATQIISRCRAVFQLEIPLLSLFETRTIAGLAGQIARLMLTQSLQPPVATTTDFGESSAEFTRSPSQAEQREEIAL